VQDVVGRIRFDAALDVAHFTLGYEERFAGIREAPLVEFIAAGEIPWHRIWFIKAGALVVWDRRERIDLILGSGATPAADLAAVQRACAAASAPVPAPPVRRRGAGAPEFVAQPCWRFDGGRGAWVAVDGGPGDVTAESLLVATYNVLFDLHEAEHIYSERRRAACIALLQAQDADIVALQEVTPEFWAELLATPWIRERYHVSSGPDAAGLEPYGQALLSRWPLALELHAFSARKRLLVGRTTLAGRPLTVAAVHLTSNQKDGAADKRAEQLAVIGARLARDGGDAIVLGDFNFGDGDEDAQLAGVALQDAWRVVHPHHPGFTFDPVANPLATRMSRSGVAGRYDRVLLRAPTQALAPIDVVMFGERPFAEQGGHPMFASDHFGLCCLLQVAGAARPELGALATAPPVHTSALVVTPPARLWPDIDVIRAVHDPSHGRWMPHINLVYGFVAAAQFEAAARAIAAVVAGRAPFRVRLGELRRFEHRGSTTVWLAPISEPPGALEALQAALAALFPACDEQRGRSPTGWTPHLTVARLTGSAAEISAKIAGWQAQWRPLEFTVDAVHLIGRAADGPFAVRRSVTFAGATTVNVDTEISPTNVGAEISAENADDGMNVFAPGVAPLPAYAALPGPRHVEAVAAVARACMAALGVEGPCVHVVGSARLGVAVADSDLDLVCAGPAERDREAFFAAVRGQLAAQGLLDGAREAGSAGVAVLRCRIGELPVDLQYAGLPAALAQRGLEALAVAELEQLDEVSRRAALGCVEADALVRLVGAHVEVATFIAFLRRVRAWARARQLDVGAWGLLGGYTWALLAAFAARDAAGAGLGDDPDALLGRFFALFAAWEPGRPVTLRDEMVAPASRRAPWPIHTLTPPTFNSARGLTRSTVALLRAELERGRGLVADAAALCEPVAAASRRIVLTLHGPPDDLPDGAGWLDGRVLGLLLALEDQGAQVRPYPRALHGNWRREYAVGVEGGVNGSLVAAARRFVEDFTAWIGRPPELTLTAALVLR